MPSRWTARRRRFRELIASDACYHPASVHDPISARIAHDLGYEIGMYAGSTASLTVLGAPDLIVLTLTEFAAQALRISRGADLSVMVDADHGYGNALNVMRTVEELELSGISGMSIEDTWLPRRFGSSPKGELLSVEEGTGKMKAAVAARRDPDLVIAGRTSAPMLSSLEDTIARANAYEAAGVDAIFLVGISAREQLDAVAAATKAPLILGTAPASMLDKTYLASRRVRICLTGHQPFAASVQAIHDTLKALRDGTKPADLKGIASADMMKRVTRAADYDAWTRDFLGGKS
jgi:carboxyvinyl-carboxyphosphonate phosphorylmutase